MNHLVEESPDGILVLAPDGAIQFINAAANALFDGRLLAGDPFGFPVADAAPQDLTITRKDGALATVEMRVGEMEWRGDRATMITLRDVTERQRAEERERLASEVLTRLNHPESATDTIRDILQIVNKREGFEAVGIRLREGDDFPYYATDGFSDDFVRAERYLCERDAAGNVVRDGTGNPVLECMCGNIIRGRTDPALPFFTEGGSFWTNCTTQLLATTTEKERQSRIRNRCNGEGYESVALIPLRSGDKIIGLLQLNDHRPNRFTPETIRFLEGLGATIGIALSRKGAEEALRDSEARYRILFEESTEGIVIANFETKILKYANPALCRMLGYTEEELRTMGVADIHPKEALQSVMVEFEAQARGDKILAEGLPCLRKDGTVLYADINAVKIIIDGKSCIVGFFRDVTKRKKAEEALRESEARYRRITESLTDYQYTVRVENGRAVETTQSPACETVTGYTPEEFAADPYLWFRMVAPEDRELVRLRVQQVLAGEEIPPIEHRILRKDGETRWVCDTTILHKDASGNLVRYDGVIKDITERKRAEAERGRLQEQLRVSQKMEAIGRLAGGVAHDFNNLLCVILNYTVFAIEGAREGDPLKNDLLEVKKAGERAVALTRQLLAFSRKQVLQPVPLNLNEIAEGVEKMLRRILGEDIDFVQVLAPDLGLTLADRGQIEQVLMNLVVNARDAMPEGGKLTIETSNVELDEKYTARHVAVNPGSYVQLSVTDTGCGMDEQAKARIFEPFFTTKEKDKGTGLGLSTVYGIVKQSGGDIWVYSEPGQGTTFKIYLPRDLSDTAAAVVTEFPSVPRRVTGTETILVVEDEEGLRKVAGRALEAAGYTVLAAADGDEALLTSAQHVGDIHLLLTDVVMPRMGGRVLAERLTKTRPTLKVLYMSGYTDNAIVHHGVLDAGTHFLAKPFTAADVTRKVREALDSGIPNPPDGHEKEVRADAEMEEQPLDKDALRALPPDVLGKLRKAVIAARYDEIVELIETIRATKPDVATGLRRMTDLFDYDRMRDLLSE
jgi:PAS domain S-box-containing protein